MPVTRKGKLSSGELKNKALAGLDRGLILAAQLVAQRATSRAPIDTGRLKRSITFGHADGDIQQGRPYSRPGGSRAIDIGTNVSYARAQEFGNRIVRAQPYLKPAIEESEKDVIKVISNSVVGAMKS